MWTLFLKVKYFNIPTSIVSEFILYLQCLLYRILHRIVTQNMKKALITFATLALIGASCTNDCENMIPQDNQKNTPITVSANVAKLTTRAGYEATTVLPETFYLTVDQDGDAKYDYTNVEMVKGANGNTYSTADASTLFWASSDRDVIVNAYTVEGETFSVQTDQSATDGSGVIASDLLGATNSNGGGISIDGNNIAIDLRHLLCKLDITFTWDTELDDVTNKSITSVKYCGFGTDVTLDRSTSIVTASTTTADIAAYVSGTTSEVIFAPYVVITPKILITANIDGEARVFSFNVTTPADGFLSGYRYTSNLTITAASKSEATIESSVTAWNEGTIIGGKAEEIVNLPTAVDLGLSVKWANYNVGATAPEEYGDYYAWGETEPKETYTWENYKWCDYVSSSNYTLTKYCTNSRYGTVDNKTTLDSEDDVARVKWGDTWRMPTSEEIKELCSECTWIATTLNGVNGYQVTGSNGNSIFLPAAGGFYDTAILNRGSNSVYWSASLSEYSTSSASFLYSNVNDDYYDLGSSDTRINGLPIRPVTE